MIMGAAADLACRFTEITLNGTWVANTNYKKELDGLDWTIATARFKSLNTIALLAQHINYYVEGILAVFKGGSLDIRDKYSFDFDPITSQGQWDDFAAHFFSNAEAFAAMVARMPDEKMDQVFVDEKYGTYRRNIDAMIEHAYYHLGQIVLIKKILGHTD